MERLETRLVPAFTGSINFNPGTGNLSVIGTDDQASFTVTASAGNTITITDGGGLTHAFTPVTGNININIATTNVAAFTGTLALGGQSLLGNTNLTFTRASTGAALLTETVTGAGSILGKTTLTATNGPTAAAPTAVTISGSVVNLVGGLAINTNGTGTDTVTVNPAATSTIGPMTVTENGAQGSIDKLLNIGTAAGGASINGGLTVNGVDSAVIGTVGTIGVNGSVNITTRNNTVGGSVITLGPTSTVIGNVTTKMANNGVTGTPDVETLSGAIFGSLNATLGSGTNTLNANTATTFIAGTVVMYGSNGTNAINLNGGTFSGSSIVFTAGNGNNTLNLAGANAGNARLTVSVGNGTNSVAFGAGATLASATLIGGYGSNTFSGTVNFPLTTYRFS